MHHRHVVIRHTVVGPEANDATNAHCRIHGMAHVCAFLPGRRVLAAPALGGSLAAPALAPCSAAAAGAAASTSSSPSGFRWWVCKGLVATTSRAPEPNGIARYSPRHPGAVRIEASTARSVWIARATIPTSAVDSGNHLHIHPVQQRRVLLHKLYCQAACMLRREIIRRLNRWCT